MSWTPLADVFAAPSVDNYCTQAEVSFQTADLEQVADKSFANLGPDQAAGVGQAAADPATGFGPAAKGDQLVAKNASVDQLFAVAGEADLLQGERAATAAADGSPDIVAASALDTVPAPFWHKVGDQPTLAPSWYGNQGPVTREVYYDTKLTSAQNGQLLAGVISNLSAGDHVRIHGGTYSINSFFMIKAAGTAERPVTIEGAAGEQVVITRSDASQNIVNVDQSQYLIMEGLTLKGGSTGLRLYSVDHFMLHDVEIRNTANNAISANSRNTSYLYFIDNEIHHTGDHGEGFYLGAHDGAVVTHHTYVIGNYIHDLTGGTINQGDGIEVKDGSYAVTIKYNFIENTNYPGIIVYRTGRGMTDRNIIEENVVLHSNDVGIQATADAIIRNNLVISRNAFLSKPFTTAPQNLTVVNNTFVADTIALRTYSWGSTNTLANNAIYSGTQSYIPTGTGTAKTANNVLVTNLATAFTNLKLDGSGLDATPVAGSPLIGAAGAAYLPALDLNGDVRTTGADVGAVDYVSERVDTVALNRFDFGSAASPVATGQTRVTPATKYSSATGYGWLSGAVYARDRGTPDDIRRDFNGAASGSVVFGADVPAGTYRVTLVYGDASSAAANAALLLEGTQVDTLSATRGQFITKTYLVNVSDGQLTLQMNHGGGTNFTALDSLSIEAVNTSSAGFVVSPVSGLSTAESGSTTSFTVALSSQPTADVSLAVSSSDSTEGTVGSSRLTFTPSNWNQPQTVRVTGVDDTLSDGDVSYRIVLAAAESTDLAYSGLDAPDVSVVNVDNDAATAAPTSGFDFGKSTSPIAAGNKGVTPTDKYNSAAGYGWLSGVVYAVDRGTPDDLRRDFNGAASGSMVFGADVPAGTYRVTLVYGDASYTAANAALLLEGTQVDTLSTTKGQFITKTYLVNVSDGQLTLQMNHGGGTNFTALDSLLIEPVA